MDRKKLREVVINLDERIDLEVGINPMTNEEGIKINGLPNEYDIEFIRNNRDDIIEILKELESEKEIKKIEVKVNFEEELFEKLRQEAIEKEITLEKLIIEKLK